LSYNAVFTNTSQSVCKIPRVAGGEAERVGGTVGAPWEAGELKPLGAEALARRFARAMLTRDPRGAAACFSPSARILTADGTEVSGREAVEAVLRQITSSDQSLEIRIGRTVVAGGVASSTQFWRRSGPGWERQRHERATVARLVLAHSGGRWEIAIANPWE
jgi:uncharacterized protein (TIGR02246 family)